MEQENKDLLLRDLCARLPYEVKIQSTDENIVTLTGINLPNHYSTINGVYSFDCYPMKPYLLPLSSMTEEQNLEYLSTCMGGNAHCPTSKTFDWCLKNHFDYRDLIPMGLANDATGLNVYTNSDK